MTRVARADEPAPPAGSITYPRDNPVEDFLHSADVKFEGFRDDPAFYGALFIVWKPRAARPHHRHPQ